LKRENERHRKTKEYDMKKLVAMLLALTMILSGAALADAA